MKKLIALLALLFIGAPSVTLATPVFWEINTGGFGYETGWSITQTTGGTFSAGMSTGSMASYTDYTYNWDLTPGDYLLAMSDTYGDGLDNGGHATLIVDGSTLLSCGSCFGYSYRLQFVVPEGDAPAPAPLALIGLGLLAMGFVRNKKTD
ncbi:MAG: hypothetical protein ABW149_02835 [Sedimenticola sp.]